MAHEAEAADARGAKAASEAAGRIDQAHAQTKRRRRRLNSGFITVVSMFVIWFLAQQIPVLRFLSDQPWLVCVLGMLVAMCYLLGTRQGGNR